MNRDMIDYTVFQTVDSPFIDDISHFYAASADGSAHPPDNTTIPPFYFAKLAYPAIKKIITNPALGVNLLDMVHASTEVKIHLPLLYGESFNLATSIHDIVPTSRGSLLQVRSQIKRKDVMHLEAVIGLLVRSKKRSTPHPAKEVAFSCENLLYTVQMPTRPRQQIDYAKASGDHNFIHTSRFVARLAGFPAPIMHGNCIMAMAFQRLEDWLAPASAITQITGRFSTPVIPGESLCLEVYGGSAAGQMHYLVKNGKGRIVIKDGIVTVKKKPVYPLCS